MVFLSDITSFYYFIKGFLALLSVVSTAISQHHESSFFSNELLFKVFWREASMWQPSRHWSSLGRATRKSVSPSARSFEGSLSLPDNPNTWITKPSKKLLLMARKMMSCVTFGPADRAGRGSRESEMFKGLKKLLEERQPLNTGLESRIRLAPAFQGFSAEMWIFF